MIRTGLKYLANRGLKAAQCKVCGTSNLGLLGSRQKLNKDFTSVSSRMIIFNVVGAFQSYEDGNSANSTLREV